ncbi:DUF4111 domain-containing protein [Rhizobium sp. P40RR-XXII]|uniref:aminoglycoside adenylyltransferase family protein n=1 Tax=unclassified Rhizobium TaxID=2613769 RepID=UPI0014577F1A|nr:MULTISPECIES: aminoglycoside adenylyltransferase family protein [unclassified Rhizobium]NLR83198.1 DUF4111 domain-containing protein [Rhizobium sp. P28RR-XV]NLS15618.1 DUF4111 domain-containing protein [Rhizobium sp. P40RR-XXII]
MRAAASRIPAEARAVSAIARRVFADGLLAVYLHGSAVAGGLRPQSDVDILAVIDQPMSDAMRKNLLSSLLDVSGRYPVSPGTPPCIELMVFLGDHLAAPAFPARSEFVYGEWLREGFEAGTVPKPHSDPENTLVLAQARQQACPLFGPAPVDLLAEIPMDHIRRAMLEALPALLVNLPGDERNVLLTLARMWRTAATGEFVTKDIAADWAASRLPKQPARTLLHAREGYLGNVRDDWTIRQDEAGQAAACLHQHVLSLL